MKIVTVIFLSIITLSGIFQNAVIFSVFKIKQNYIANNLCINKDAPESTCKGACFLNEKIEENNQKERENPLPVHENKQTIEYYCSAIEKLDLRPYTTKKPLKKAKNVFRASDYAFRLFRPPEC